MAKADRALTEASRREDALKRRMIQLEAELQAHNMDACAARGTVVGLLGMCSEWSRIFNQDLVEERRDTLNMSPAQLLDVLSRDMQQLHAIITDAAQSTKE